MPARGRVARQRLQPVAQDRVQVGEQQQRDFGAARGSRPPSRAPVASVVPARERPLGGALDHRAVGDRDRRRERPVRSGRRRRAPAPRTSPARPVRRRIAGGDVGDEALAALRAAGASKRSGDAGRGSVSIQFREVLAVDVDVFVAAAGEVDDENLILRLAGARRIASATACADSSAGMMPSVRDSVRAAVQRLRSPMRDVLRAALIVQPGVLRARPARSPGPPRPSASAPPARRRPASR